MYCPVCEKSSKFQSYNKNKPRPNARCGHCGSLERHRLVWRFFQLRTNLFDGEPKRMLHVAPEWGFQSRLKKRLGGGYVSADSDPDKAKAMVQIDVMDLMFRDGWFDVVYCSHVLEHVKDDRAALRELRRVLAPGGWAVFMVPIIAERTWEDPSITDPAERLKHFGQKDHVRAYGLDFVDRLTEAGFNARTVTHRDFLGVDEARSMNLPGDPIFLCVDY